MAARLIIRAFVNERLTAAAEEIFQVFERTINKYEEEASSSQQEIERLRGLLLELVTNQRTDFSQSSICKEETPPEQLHCEQEPSLRVCQRDPEPRHIKEEDHELWPSQRQEEDEQVQEFEDADVSHLPHLSAWDEQEDTKPPQTQNSESEEQFEELQETKTVQRFVLPRASTSQTLIQNQRVQDGRENERPAASFTNQTQTDQSQSAVTISTELSHLNSVLPDYRCHLCDKCFSSNHHLINHASRMHSKEEDVLCAVCGKTLESTESLNLHLKLHKGSKCCHVCGKHCNSTTALAEHMASHAGVKLHRCHVCGKECSRKGDLKIHMRIHTGEKPFCCSYCLKSFTHSGHLRKHLRSHTGERPHQCDICGRGFLQSAHLKYHLGTHAQKY
ncbi:zinc finger and SCAN domain-containing protein 26-like [Morone saxatilis]|uniref:zinc finger and SCAN domain-containing protein 26-like n=1 Tax=Morone saxatilis TaxID=34816 RepID=UPI0015E1DAF5|nr:zinc finger and SCAN domain-containing protein 26-like [Morone saxatilis]